jgi:hypothetical protein
MQHISFHTAEARLSKNLHEYIEYHQLLTPVRHVGTRCRQTFQNILQFRSEILYESLFSRSLLLRGKILAAFLSFASKYLLALDATPCQLEDSADAEEYEDDAQPS